MGSTSDMPCCAILILLFLGPRIAIILFALFSTFFQQPFNGLLIPVLGFIFMPWTLLAYAWAINSTGQVAGLQLAVVILAALVDLGVIGGGASRRGKSN